MTDEVQRLREGIAKEYGITLYKRYSEEEAAHLIGIDHSRLKKMRAKGDVPYIPSLGPRTIRYFGYQIIDVIAFGSKWKEVTPLWDVIQNANQPPGNTGLATTGSASAQTAQHTTEPITTPEPSKPEK